MDNIWGTRTTQIVHESVGVDDQEIRAAPRIEKGPWFPKSSLVVEVYVATMLPCRQVDIVTS